MGDYCSVRILSGRLSLVCTAELTFERDGKEHTIQMEKRQFGDETTKRMGFTYSAEVEKPGFFKSIQYGAYTAKYWVEYTLECLKMLLTGEVGVNQLSGPVGIVEVVNDTYDAAAPSGWSAVILSMMNLGILISANLGVMNLLPIPALDGGRLVFLLIEAVEPAVVQYFYAQTLEELKGIAVENGQFPTFVPHEGWLDGVSFYAGKTAGDDTNRYLWGWCPTREGQKTTGTKSWAGALVAHRLIQNGDGTLSLDVPQAISAKYSQSVTLAEKTKVGDVTVNTSSYTLKANSFVRFARLRSRNKITMTATIPEENEAVFGLSFVDCSDKAEKARIFIEDKYNFLKLKEVEVNEKTGEWNDAGAITERAITPAADNVYHIEVYTEESVCVVYINGRYAFTNRIYDLAKNPWAIFCTEGEVTVSDIKLSTY